MTASEFVRWEDGGAGGQCGKIVNDDFVEEPNHQLVTHSKTPSTPGIGTLKAFWDDPLPQQFEDPQTHQMVTMADNDEAFK